MPSPSPSPAATADAISGSAPTPGHTPAPAAAPRITAADVDLIPWDHDSPAHHDRLLTQRFACGWRFDEMPEWDRKSREGTKTLYWIVLKETHPSYTTIVTKHTTQFPKESSPLHDTALTTFNHPRPSSQTPSSSPSSSPRTIHPLGHFALDRSRPAEELRTGLASTATSVCWVCNLYVSWALQATGLGKAAMLRAEDLARGPPLSADVMALDSLPEEFQLRPDFVARTYVAQGNPAPVKSNQRWYERLGYETFASEKGAYLSTDPNTGEKHPLDVVYLRKTLK